MGIRLARAVALFAVSLASGCSVPFLRPLSTAATATTDRGLAGTWLAEGETRVQAVVAEAADSVYGVTLDVWHEGEHRTTLHLDMRLVRLGKATFADLSLGEEESGRLGRAYGLLAIAAHQIFRVEREGDTLRARALSEKWLDKALLRGDLSLPHERVPAGNDEVLVVRAATDQMQRFFREHAERAEAFDEPVVFRRQAAVSESSPPAGGAPRDRR